MDCKNFGYVLLLKAKVSCVSITVAMKAPQALGSHGFTVKVIPKQLSKKREFFCSLSSTFSKQITTTTLYLDFFIKQHPLIYFYIKNDGDGDNNSSNVLPLLLILQSSLP